MRDEQFDSERDNLLQRETRVLHVVVRGGNLLYREVIICFRERNNLLQRKMNNFLHRYRIICFKEGQLSLEKGVIILKRGTICLRERIDMLQRGKLSEGEGHFASKRWSILFI